MKSVFQNQLCCIEIFPIWPKNGNRTELSRPRRPTANFYECIFFSIQIHLHRNFLDRSNHVQTVPNSPTTLTCSLAVQFCYFKYSYFECRVLHFISVWFEWLEQSRGGASRKKSSSSRARMLCKKFRLELGRVKKHHENFRLETSRTTKVSAYSAVSSNCTGTIIIFWIYFKKNILNKTWFFM